MAAPALAQEGGEETAPTPDLAQPAADAAVAPSVIFAWAYAEGGAAQNWPTGLIYALLGIVGALTMVYLFLGEFLPSMGGKAEYEALKGELEDYKVRRDETLKNREKYARGEAAALTLERLTAENNLTDDYDKTIERLERQISQDRWRLFWLGFPIYLVLGGFFAAAFASNEIQAILIGFGWTAIADRIGLQREFAVKKESKDSTIIQLETRARQAQVELEAMKLREEQLKTEFQKTIQGLIETFSHPSP
jgi:hypothetical protein